MTGNSTARLPGSADVSKNSFEGESLSWLSRCSRGGWCSSPSERSVISAAIKRCKLHLFTLNTQKGSGVIGLIPSYQCSTLQTLALENLTTVSKAAEPLWLSLAWCTTKNKDKTMPRFRCQKTYSQISEWFPFCRDIDSVFTMTMNSAKQLKMLFLKIPRADHWWHYWPAKRGQQKLHFHGFCLEGYCSKKARKYWWQGNRLSSGQFEPKYCGRSCLNRKLLPRKWNSS